MLGQCISNMNKLYWFDGRPNQAETHGNTKERVRKINLNSWYRHNFLFDCDYIISICVCMCVALCTTMVWTKKFGQSPTYIIDNYYNDYLLIYEQYASYDGHHIIIE